MEFDFLKKLNFVEQRKKWFTVVVVLAAIVVFCTSYALILPAITIEDKPVCGIDEHIHSKDCYEINVETGKAKLICKYDEHIHDMSCYPEKSAKKEYFCGMDEHKHNEECYNEKKELICNKQEHTHSQACRLKDSDNTADVETSDDWDAMVKEIKFSKDESRNIIRVAQSQLGYTESKNNFIVAADGEVLGYSRFGAWNSKPYEKWNIDFIGFCMKYAGIKNVPFSSNCGSWINMLKNSNYATFFDAGTYQPHPGDIVFINENNECIAGIVSEIETNGKVVMRIKVILGDSLNCVRYVTYEECDSEIMGYANIYNSTTKVLKQECGDYTVSVTYTDKSELPWDVELSVKKIKKGSKAYKRYYKSFINKMIKSAKAKSEKDLGLSFAELFDIKLMSGDEVVEPADEVTVNIQMNNDIEVKEGMGTSLLQMESDVPDIVESDDEIDDEKLSSVSFKQQSSSIDMILITEATYYVWLDGTDGGIMSLYDSPNEVRTVTNGRITLPTTWTSPSKYNYKLNGWYDIYNYRYYAPGETATVNRNTVFYADWVSANYDYGVKDSHVTTEIDTSEFIKTEVFDYSAVFNAQSTSFTGTVNNTSHSETWSLVKTGNVSYQSARTLDFIFRDWDTGGKSISYPANLDTKADNQGNKTTVNILSEVRNASGKDLIDVLFNTQTAYNTQTKTGIIGKNYVGSGNYLYQYMDASSYNYDNKHNGYYYYDSGLHAASYNQSEQRFYVYDYLERTSDSLKDSSGTVYGNSDFLPFNSPYVRPANKVETTYTVDGREGVNYQYDAKYDGQQSASNRVATNYWYGLSSTIDFYLPHNSGAMSGGKYLNRSLTGQELIFEFSGDDDVWVFVDGTLILDIGGLHAVRSGNINFSRGTATVYHVDNTATTTNYNFASGDHQLTIYYLERGGSQSNCAIYFNITPRYAVEVSKVDSFTYDYLDGAEISFYSDAACTQPVQLWDSKEAYDSAAAAKNTFRSDKGYIKCWGFVEGNTYYIKETHPPNDTDYPQVIDDVICLTLGNYQGNTTYVGTVDPGPDGIYDEGFEIKNWSFNQDDLAVTFDITNSKIGSTQIKVEKLWDHVESKPLEVFAYVTADGKKVGYECELNEANNWSHIWYGLPKFNERNEEIYYSVEEIWANGFKYDITEGTYTTLNGETAKKYILTNSYVDDSDLTSLTVNKTWLDGASHTDDEAIVHLVANGKDTYMKLTLNEENEWTGVFDGIPFSDDGQPITYSVIEEKVSGYQATYSALQENGLREIVVWNSATALANNNIYRFVSGEYALACNSSGGLVSAKNNPNDDFQYWKFSDNKLQNVKTGKYLAFSNNAYTTNNTGTAITLNNRRIRYTVQRTNYNISLDSNGVTTVTGNGGTQFSIYSKTTNYGKMTYKITVSNDIATYLLPDTGGIGTYFFTFGGFSLMIIGLMYGYRLKSSRKRRVGERE